MTAITAVVRIENDGLPLILFPAEDPTSILVWSPFDGHMTASRWYIWNQTRPAIGKEEAEAKARYERIHDCQLRTVKRYRTRKAS